MPAFLQQFVVRLARLDGASIDTREKLYDELRPRQGYLRWTLQFCHPRLARGHPGQPWLRRHATHTSQRFPHAAALPLEINCPGLFTLVLRLSGALPARLRLALGQRLARHEQE
jgi:hypothetical protein